MSEARSLRRCWSRMSSAIADSLAPTRIARSHVSGACAAISLTRPSPPIMAASSSTLAMARSRENGNEQS